MCRSLSHHFIKHEYNAAKRLDSWRLHYENRVSRGLPYGSGKPWVVEAPSFAVRVVLPGDVVLCRRARTGLPICSGAGSEHISGRVCFSANSHARRLGSHYSRAQEAIRLRVAHGMGKIEGKIKMKMLIDSGSEMCVMSRDLPCRPEAVLSRVFTDLDS